MHDWWSAFILIANREGSRISRGGWTAKSLRPESVQPHWKSLLENTFSLVKVKMQVCICQVTP